MGRLKSTQMKRRLPDGSLSTFCMLLVAMNDARRGSSSMAVPHGRFIFTAGSCTTFFRNPSCSFGEIWLNSSRLMSSSSDIALNTCFFSASCRLSQYPHFSSGGSSRRQNVLLLKPWSEMSSGTLLLPYSSPVLPVHCATIPRNHVWNLSLHSGSSVGTVSASLPIWSLPSQRPTHLARKSPMGSKQPMKSDPT